MFGIFSWIAAGFKGLGQILIMPFTKWHSSSRFQSTVRWLLHGIAVAGVLLGLWFLNYALHLDTVLLTPYPVLRSIWLPVLGLQLYIVSWVGWWLCHAMTSQHKVGQFPDLDQAWEKTLAALEQATISLESTPLFLVLGSPTGSTADFFNAGRMVRSLPILPAVEQAPFRVFANEEAIYVCCEHNSLLGAQTELFRAAYSKSHSVESRGPGRQSNTQYFDQDVSRFENFADSASLPAAGSAAKSASTILASNGAGTAAQLGAAGGGQDGLATGKPRTTTATLPRQAASENTTGVAAVGGDAMAKLESHLALLEQEKENDRREAIGTALPAPQVFQPRRRIQVPLLQDKDVIEKANDRLVHLCRMINKARAPYCAINGVVTLIPWKASTDQRVANHTGMLIDQDLQAISEGTMIAPPSIAVFCDLEQAEGCSELIARFPEGQRHRRLGIRFPRVPECDRGRVDTMIRDGLRWLCQQMVPPVVNRLFQTERNLTEEQPVNQANTRLFGFTSELRHRQEAMVRIIRRGFLGGAQIPSRLRGCYLAACGKDAMTQQAFTAGIMSQVLEMQNDVQWTEKALQRDRDFHRWIVTGYVGLASVLAVLVLTLVF